MMGHFDMVDAFGNSLCHFMTIRAIRAITGSVHFQQGSLDKVPVIEINFDLPFIVFLIFIRKSTFIDIGYFQHYIGWLCITWNLDIRLQNNSLKGFQATFDCHLWGFRFNAFGRNGQIKAGNRFCASIEDVTRKVDTDFLFLRITFNESKIAFEIHQSKIFVHMMFTDNSSLCAQYRYNSVVYESAGMVHPIFASIIRI